MKPIKRGYKLWEMADMDGYLYKFEVYQGKCENKSIQNLPKFIGLGDRIICQMTASLHNKYHEVYTDNFLYICTFRTYLAWLISTPCSQVTAKKRRKSIFSVPASIRTENVGFDWVVYDKSEEDVKSVSERKLKRGLISNALPAKYIYV